MLPDRVPNPGPATYESGALPIALRGPAPMQNYWRGLVNRKLVEAPSNFIDGRPKAALLFWFFIVVLLSVCLWSASTVATCIAAHFALCDAL